MKAEAEAFIFNPKHNSQQVLQILEALKQASHNLHQNPYSNNKTFSYVKALLELQHESESFLSNDPHLTTLSTHLTALKTLIHKDHNSCSSPRRFIGLKSFLARRVNSLQISKLAASIETEIQRWIGRELVETLAETLRRAHQTKDQVLIDLIQQFEERIARGFDRDLQDSILRSKVFAELESILCNGNEEGEGKFSSNVREAAGSAITELIRFNKDVFVGQVLMGETVRALIELSSVRSLQTLGMLIRLIKSPIVDEMESNGEIGRIVKLLSHDELLIRVMAMECVLAVGYFGRKEAVEAMLKEDLVKTLVELQRSEMRGFERCGVWTEGRHLSDTRCIEERSWNDVNNNNMERRPFASCVARFAVQLEVGQGLRPREKRALKQEVLRRVREAHVSEAEAATIIAEVLWGASP